MEEVQALGKYEIRGTLGRGAMGVVYDGWDPLIARRVAIKAVRLPEQPESDTTEEIARFRREAQAAGRLSHPNIVAVYDYGETSELAYIVMEFVDGTTLKHLLDRQERFAVPDTVQIMQDVLNGLHYSHTHGVVHRDVKPANIMLTSAGQAKIADFGIARIESSSMTQAGTLLGTPAYMSPEQFMGQVVNERTDIYSSGVLLYQLLTGERPFEGSMTAIMHKVLNTEPPAPSQLAVTSPVGLDAVVHRAMSKRPEDRYSSAAVFAEAIAKGAAAPPVPIPAEPAPEATLVAAPPRPPAAPKMSPVMTPSNPEPRRSGGRLLVAAAAAGIAVLVAGGWLVLRPVPSTTIGTGQQTPGGTEPSSSPASAPVSTAEAPAAPSVVAANPLRGEAPGGAIGAPPAKTSPAPQTPAPQAVAPSASPTQSSSQPPPQAAVTTAPSPPLGGVVASPPVTAPTSPPTAHPPAETAATVAPAPPPGGAVASLPIAAPTPPPALPAETASPVAASPPPGGAAANPPAAAPIPPSAAQPPAGAAPVTSLPGGTSASPTIATPPQPPISPPANTASEQVAAIGLGSLRRQIERALGGAPCALVNATVEDSGTVTAAGMAGRAADDALRHEVAGLIGSRALDWRVQRIDPVFCDALSAIRPVAPLAGAPDAGLRLSLAGDRTALRDGELIRPQVTMPDFPGLLRVDYLAHDGSLAHLYPTVADPQQHFVAIPARTLRPGETMEIGRPGAGHPQWEVGPPFGTDMIIAVASSVPLLSSPPAQNFERDGTAYLRRLGRAIEAARRGSADVTGTVMLVDTLPKSP